MTDHRESIRLELDYLRLLLNDLQAKDALIQSGATNLHEGLTGALELLPAVVTTAAGDALLQVTRSLADTMRTLKDLAEQNTATLELVGGRIERLTTELAELAEERDA